MIGPSAKLIIVAVTGTLATAALAYVLSVMAERDRLEADNTTLIDANQTHQAAMHEMAQEMAAQNQAVIDRDKRNRATQSRLRATERRLRDAESNPQITVVQRECMDSGVPDPIIDILRESPHRNGSDPTGSGLPRSGTLFGTDSAPFRGSDLVGFGGLCEGFAVSHPLAEPGQGRDPGVL